ncbi:MAG: succinate dehydrogenase [Phycisphaeraceae bacterium]|nr:MAG: succinate dehydrogenase [Phycisphaeraceae bacterium]
MTRKKAKPEVGRWGTVEVPPGESREVKLTLSESYFGADSRIPVYVWRGKEPGPTVMVSAAVHGDEINGTGAIRQIITDKPFDLRAGSLVLVPVINRLGFERHSRYLPDRRDLNRCFPGSSGGSLASRLAHVISRELVTRCDYGIDLHTAAVRRTNFPNVRADMDDPKVAALARAFGAELIVHGKGPQGSLRRSACKAGCATLILEAGEVWKVEPTVMEYAIRGVRNCLSSLGMIDDPHEPPAYQIIADKSRWVRASRGGFLQFHVAPGDIVDAGDLIATNTSVTGREYNVIKAPTAGIVLGMTTIPSVAPGDPVCHIAYPNGGTLDKATRGHADAHPQSLHERTRDDLATGFVVTRPDDED